jgi:sulfur carrier protein
MKVQFNGETRDIQDQTLADLLAREKLDTKTGIAVAVNSRVVSRNQWSAHQLQDHDNILIITATAGG